MRGVIHATKIIPHKDKSGCPHPARNFMPNVAESRMVKRKGPVPMSSKNRLSKLASGLSFIKAGFFPSNKMENNNKAGNTTSNCCQANWRGKIKWLTGLGG